MKLLNGGARAVAVRTVALGRGFSASAGAALSVAAFDDEMDASLDSLLGCNRGFSRFADWHIGVDLGSGGTSLDENAEWLCARSIGFHNGGETGAAGGDDDTAAVGGTGSNWARGASGVAVEFRAEYDGSWFDSANELDYCSPSGFGSAAQPNAVDWCEGADVTEDHGGHDPRTVDDEVGKPGSGLVD